MSNINCFKNIVYRLCEGVFRKCNFEGLGLITCWNRARKISCVPPSQSLQIHSYLDLFHGLVALLVAKKSSSSLLVVHPFFEIRIEDWITKNIKSLSSNRSFWIVKKFCVHYVLNIGMITTHQQILNNIPEGTFEQKGTFALY